jgi:hypothetical protein
MSEVEKNTLPERKEAAVILAELLDQNRSISSEYQRLIQIQKSWTNPLERFEFSTPYTFCWRHLYPELYRLIRFKLDDGTKQVIGQLEIPKTAREELEFFQKFLSGSMLIDLGGGIGRSEPEKQGTGSMWRFAELCGVATYINVDRFALGKEDEPANPYKPVQEISNDQLQQIAVKDDMLDFTARIKDNSAQFVLNGIDRYIVQSEGYAKALAQEIYRATIPHGLMFGNDQVILDFLPKDKIRRIPVIKQPNIESELFSKHEHVVLPAFFTGEHNDNCRIFEKIG